MCTISTPLPSPSGITGVMCSFKKELDLQINLFYQIMGSCCSKEMGPAADAYGASPGPAASTTHAAEPRASSNKAVDSRIIDSLVLELLDLIASFVDK